MPTQTINLGQYKFSIPAEWKINGKREKITEEIKRIFEESEFFEKISNVKTRKGEGLEIKRFFTKDNTDPMTTVQWVKRDCVITNPYGSVVFKMKDAEVPETFSQVASDVLISKYLRKAEVPQFDEKGRQILNESGSPKLGPEKSAKQIFKRLTGCWRHWGEKYGYFKSESDAQIFEDETGYMLAHQIAAPNSPQWFNTGLNWAYGITGPAQGHYYVNPDTTVLTKSKDAYSRPQPHACFIQSVKDDLINKGGIMDLWTREARIFKYGSGTGTNFSAIRGKGEKLSGGGSSSGLMSFLKIGDAAAGAIKSGGTTRRAAKMICLDIDHPEIEEFITWKAKEEKKVQALVDKGYSSDFEGEAYQTVSGQHSNNSVRIGTAFMQALEQKGIWELKQRTDSSVYKTLPAEKLWNQIAESAWMSADPGVQFDTTINEWHTCPNSGKINASNPCSEYMFLDDTACNLASLNLMKFTQKKTINESNGKEEIPVYFDVKAFEYAVRLWTIVLEISVLMAQYPSKAIARNSYDFRSLGLGYANLGTLLMVSSIPYDSDKARAIAGAITAIMTGYAYSASAELARHLGPFSKYAQNKKAMLKVIRNHRSAVYNKEEYEELEMKPMGINPRLCPDYLLQSARSALDKALEMGEQWGFRNSQTTLIAPTGTIGLLMDCDTTGVEPDFALVKFKKLAGGGYWKMPNQSIKSALQNLGYQKTELEEILDYVEKYNMIEGAPYLKEEQLPVFDCANNCGTGKRHINPMGHVLMLAAVQPFLSGSISKTINMPNSATIDEIKDVYFNSWKLGIKAVAIYRDGCKLSQPLSTSMEKDKKDDSKNTKKNPAKDESAYNEKTMPSQLTFIERGTKKELPARRKGITIESTVAGHKIFLRTGEYDDETLGEIFIDMHKEGAAFRSLLNCFAIAVSIGLQYGVPLKKLVDKFTFTRFEPNGPTDHPNIKNATSIIDFIFRVLGMEYLNRTDFVHIKPVHIKPNDSAQKPHNNSDNSLSQFNGNLMGDAPACAECGHITVRSGNCYRCLNCGASMGCS